MSVAILILAQAKDSDHLPESNSLKPQIPINGKISSAMLKVIVGVLNLFNIGKWSNKK